jgi:hypothetical protein
MLPALEVRQDGAANRQGRYLYVRERAVASGATGQQVRSFHCADNLDELPVCVLPFVIDDVRDRHLRHAEDSAQFLLGEVF